MENGEENPAFAAAAASLVSKLSGPLKATKQLQDKEKRSSPPSLEDSVLKSMKTGGTAVFLYQKPIFVMLPTSILEMIASECGVRWRQPPLVNLLVNDRTRHLALYLTKPSNARRVDDCEGGEGWTLLEVDLLCREIARECKKSLRSLDITSNPTWAAWPDPAPPQPPTPGSPDETPPAESHPGVTAAQLCALLQEVRGLVRLHLQGNFTKQEIDSIISTLADTNPGIRDLRIPQLSNQSFTKIADTWPELEVLEVENTPILRPSPLVALAAFLFRLKKLRVLRSSVYFENLKAQAMIRVAHHHDPSTPPYQLTESHFDCYEFADNPAVSSEIVGKLFDTFPAVTELRLTHEDVPVVCAGLQGCSHIGITELELDITESYDQPLVLEPLLALIGKNLRRLKVETSSSEGTVDVSMIGHYCPILQDLSLFAEGFEANYQFKATPSYFSKLKSLSLSRTSSDGPIHLPDPLVLRLLAGPHLKAYENYDVLISEEVMASLAAASGEQRALSSLEQVTLFPWSASVEVLATLLSHAPRLQKLWVCSEEAEELEKAGVLTAFLHQTGLKAILDTQY